MKRLLKIDSTLIIILIGLSLWYISFLTNLNYLNIITGPLVIFYLLGHNFNIVINIPHNRFNILGRISLDIISSLSIVALFAFIFKDRIINNQLILIIIVYIALLGLVFIRRLYLQKEETLEKLIDTIRKLPKNKLLLVALLPATFCIVRSLTIYYVGDWDPLIYIDAAKKILDNTEAVSTINHRRYLTPELLILLQNITGLSFASIVKFIMPLWLYIGGLLFFSFCETRIKNKLTVSAVFLLSISTLSLVLNNEFFKTEVLLFALNFPILILWQEWHENKDKLVFVLLSLFYSMTAFLFHELGIILLFLSTLNMFYALFILMKKNKKKITKKKLLHSLIIIFPYIFLIKIYFPIQSIIDNDFLFMFIQNFSKFFDLNFNIWFLSGYQEIDGARFSYTGINLIFYYLLHGLPTFFIGIFLLIIARIKKIKPSIALPLILYLLIYLSIAEILPRIGVFFLPYRAWPHLSFAICLIVAIIAKDLNLKKLNYGLITLTLGATIGSFLLMYALGSSTTRSESSLIQAVSNNIDESGIVLSQQYNRSMVWLYGNRDFMYTDEMPILKNINDLKLTVMDTVKTNNAVDLARLNKEYTLKFKKDYLKTDGKIVWTKDDLIYPGDPEFLKLRIPDYSLKEKEIYDRLNNAPLYYIYSYDKLMGPFRSGPNWQKDNDAKNYKFFHSYEGSDVVYKDEHGIIIKIR